MINVSIDKTVNKIIFQTDDPTAHVLLERSITENKYIPWQRKYGTITTEYKIYDNRRIKPKNGIYTYILGLGWTTYIINVFKDYLTVDDINNLVKTAVYSDNYRTLPFPELRDYQNEDVLHLLKYKIGNFTVHTGYGKTQVISCLANYAYSLGKRVLIVTPGKKAQDEVVKRIKINYNLDVPTPDLSLNCIITSGIGNRKELKSPEGLAEFENLMASYDWVLVDEVEYTINPGGEFIYSHLIKADHFYGFSGTADKKNGEMISFVNGLSDSVIDNMGLIKYFGPSLVYRMPLDKTVNYITIKTRKLEKIKFTKEEITDEDNIYQSIMNHVLTDPEICKLIVKIVKKFPVTFIPVNNLTTILSEWINVYFKGVFRVLLVCGEGYIYYDLEGNKTSLTLAESCEYIKNGLVDVIPSTSSGYRALDFPGLENILLITGNIAGVVLQAIGRVARSNTMNIIGLDTISGKKVPVFTKGAKIRDEMVHKYYKYCKVVDSLIIEDNF